MGGDPTAGVRGRQQGCQVILRARVILMVRAVF